MGYAWGYDSTPLSCGGGVLPGYAWVYDCTRLSCTIGLLPGHPKINAGAWQVCARVCAGGRYTPLYSEKR